MAITVCHQCGKEMETKTRGRLYCTDCLKIRRRAQHRAWQQAHGKEYESIRRQKLRLEQCPPEPDWRHSLDLFTQRLELYNLSCRLSGQPELSYGYYVAKFDNPRKNAAPSAATPESGKDK